MSRKRFRRDCIASSDNYSISRKLHREYLKECHEKNQVYLETIIITIKVPYINVFGKKVRISEEEVQKLQGSVTILYL